MSTQKSDANIKDLLLAKFVTKFKVSKMNEADMVKAIKKDI